MNNIASGDGNYLYLNSIIGNNNGNKAKYITFYKTHSGLGLAISTAYYSGSRVAVANDGSSFIDPDYKFPSSKSNLKMACRFCNKFISIVMFIINGTTALRAFHNGTLVFT